MNQADIQVRHLPDQRRYTVFSDGEEAGFTEYRETGSLRLFEHTEIHPAFRGRGLTNPLFQTALDDSRAAGFQVEAECSAVVRFMLKQQQQQSE